MRKKTSLHIYNHELLKKICLDSSANLSDLLKIATENLLHIWGYDFPLINKEIFLEMFPLKESSQIKLAEQVKIMKMQIEILKEQLEKKNETI